MVMTDRSRGGGDRAMVVGTVREILPRALYRVLTADGREVVAHTGTGLGRNFVRLVVGDRVEVALSERDGLRGRIARRM